MTDIRPDLKAWLAERREAQSPGPRTLKDLAIALGVSPEALYNYVTGARTWPDGLRARLDTLMETA